MCKKISINKIHKIMKVINIVLSVICSLITMVYGIKILYAKIFVGIILILLGFLSIIFIICSNKKDRDEKLLRDVEKHVLRGF